MWSGLVLEGLQLPPPFNSHSMQDSQATFKPSFFQKPSNIQTSFLLRHRLEFQSDILDCGYISWATKIWPIFNYGNENTPVRISRRNASHCVLTWGPETVTVSSELWQAGTTPAGHLRLHSSHVKPAGKRGEGFSIVSKTRKACLARGQKKVCDKGCLFQITFWLLPICNLIFTNDSPCFLWYFIKENVLALQMLE